MESFIRKLTLGAAGVDNTTISQCTSSEQTKYSILGSLVFIPITTGVIAMAFASSYFTHNLLLIGAICLMWAGVVFVIERALIAGLRPRTWSWAVPVRIILAFAMSCIITELLMIFIFKADIYTRIAEKTATQTEQIYSAGNARVEELKADLARRKELLDQKEKAYLDEIDGRNGTGIHGYGPSAKAKEEALNQERAYYEDAKQRLEDEINAAALPRDQNVTAYTDEQNPGLLKCIVALYELSSEERNVSLALWICHIFLFFIEIFPLVVKISYDGTQYYDVMDMADKQKLEAMSLTMDDTKEMMRLASQYEIEQQKVSIKNKMMQMQYRNATELTLMEARALCDTANMLDELETHNKNNVSVEWEGKLKEEINSLFEKYLNNRVAEPLV